jgi:hypothetical protein
MNRSERASLAGPASLDVTAGATHLFEEPGALEQVGREAGQIWPAGWVVGPRMRG